MVSPNGRVFDLFARITLDTGDFSTGIDGVVKKASTAKENLKQIGTTVAEAGKSLATIGAGIAAAGGAVFAFANNVSQTGDNIDKMSQKLGMSAEAYQEWSIIMEHCGTSIDSMQASMKTLASAAETGNKAFEQLGISQEQLANMDQEELFSATITALQGVQSETERTYLAGQLLGRGATELGPLLNTSAEDVEAMRQKLHDMGAVMSDEAVKNAATFQDSLTDLKAAFSGASNGLAAELIPNITVLMDGITNFISSGGLQSLIDGFGALAPVIAGATTAMIAYKASMVISTLIETLTKATESQTIAQTLLNAVMNANPFVLVATAIAGLVGVLMTLWATNEDFRNAVEGIWNAIVSAVESAIDAIKSAIDSIKDAFGDVVSGVKNLLGIASPSKVFAGIGENMALGLGEGWDSEFSGIKKDIENGMDFGTANVDFASSGLGQSSRTIAGGVMAAASSGGMTGDIVINLTADIDGEILAHKQVRYNQREIQREGGKLTALGYA